MKRYVINYFNEKKVGYFGTLENAIGYADGFANSLVLTYRGDIVITDNYGSEVARQHWEVNEDGSSSPLDWERLG